MAKYCSWCSSKFTKKEPVHVNGLCFGCYILRGCIENKVVLLVEVERMDKDIEYWHKRIMAKRKNHTPILNDIIKEWPILTNGCK